MLVFYCRCYFEATNESCPSIVKSCVDLFHSDAVFLVLSNLTGLKLHELAGSDSESNSDGETQQRDGPQSENSGMYEM